MDFFFQFFGYLKPNGIPAALFAAQFIFAIMGATVRLVMDVANGVKNSADSPDTFHLGYFVRNNSLRIVAGAFVIYGGVYFSDLMLPTDTNEQLRMLAAVVVGAFGDVVWRAFEKWAKGKIKALSNQQ
jgi:NAD/NADP transhydrogenase beta subunit